MGCGLITQQRPSVEVHHPLALAPSERAAAARIIEDSGVGAHSRGAAHGAASSSRSLAVGSHAHGSGGHGLSRHEPRIAADAHQHHHHHHHHHHHMLAARDAAATAATSSAAEEAVQHLRPRGRRFIVGERVVLASRLPGSSQDHAFCFECGVFFHTGSQRAPQCARCGSSFIQYLRGSADQHWISANSTAGANYSFDDQLDNSITASLDEAPIARKPTKGTFLRGLQTWQLTQEADVESRARLGTADPRCTCAICRESFCLGDELRQVPCGHEFHSRCITEWLQANNTCPICRWRAPEATEEEAELEAELDVEESPPVEEQALATMEAQAQTPVEEDVEAEMGTEEEGEEDDDELSCLKCPAEERAVCGSCAAI